MSKRRPTEASWESDEDLLGDGSSVSAFSSKMQGDVTIEDIDEDALLMDDEDKSNNFSFQSQDEIVEMVDLGISSENCAFDDTANSQELDYNDEVEDVPQLEVYEAEEIEDPLFVGEQPNDTTCTAQHAHSETYTQDDNDDDDDDEDDDGSSKKDRGRFQTERKTITLLPTHTKSSDIPDSLEITKEMQEEIDTFEKQKGKGKFHNKGGFRGRGQNQQGPRHQQPRQQQQHQRFQTPMNRGGQRPRGPNFGNRSQMFQGPRNGNPNNMRHRGPNNMMRPQMPQGQFQRGQFNQGPMGPNHVFNNGRPRFPHELIQNRPPQPNQGGHGLQMPQPLMTSSPQRPQVYQESPQFIQPMGDQSQFHQPQSQIPHSQPSSGANIHVNPKFHGSLPQDIHPQQVPQSVPQPLFSQPQPIQNQFPPGNQSWMGQPPNSAQAHVNYASSPQLSHIQPQQQQQMMSPDQRPGLLGTSPQNIIRHPSPHQGNTPLQPHNMSQGQPRQMFNNQQFQPHPQKPNIRPVSQRLGPQEPNVRPVSQRLGPQQSNVRPVTQRLGHMQAGAQGQQSTGQQIRQQRPVVNQNMRGQRPANQTRGQLTQMRPRGPVPGNLGARNPQMGQPRFQAPQVSKPGEVQGFNPKPTNLVNPVMKEPDIDPEKAKKIQELEEKKRQRAERFKDNIPVTEVSLTKKKVILSKAQKRPSGDDIKETADVSPPKTIKIEKIAFNVNVKQEIKTEPEEEMDEDTALRKALEEQKRRRDLILKAKEAKRLLQANKRRQNLAVKMAQEGQTLSDMKSSGTESSGVKHNNPSQIKHVQGHQMQGQGHQYNQGHQVHNVMQQNHQGQGHMHNQQHGFQQNQFQTNVNKRGVNRGHMSNRGQISNQGQNANRGQGLRNQGQPISVLGQGSQNILSSHQAGRGRGQGQNRGRGRGVHTPTNIVQLQQVELHDNIDYESYDSQIGSGAPGNRTVLPLSSGSRQVVGMSNMGAASQGIQDRKVTEKKEAFSPQRRIVLDSKQSSSVLIKDLPPKVDIGKISKRCSEFGKTKSFNYKADERKIVVQYSTPAEATAFLKKSFRFMVDMNYCTAVSVPDNYV